MKKPALALLVLGLLQMTGQVLHVPVLAAIGAASAASPAPRVFSAVRGLETYSTKFYLEWNDWAGRAHRLALTPANYGRIAGPYNRRNVYGAVTAYGPILLTNAHTRPMFEAVSRYALCGRAPLLRELGVDPAGISGPVRVRLEPARKTPPDLPLIVEVPCDGADLSTR